MKSSVHTRRARRVEVLAKSIIMVFVFMMLALLVLIVLYVGIRGLVSSRDTVDVFADLSETVIRQDALPEQGLIFIIHKGVRVGELNALELNLLYTKNRNYWGPYSGQNLMAAPFVYTDTDDINRAAYPLLRRQDQEFNKHVQEASSPQEMIAAVEKTAGGIGYIPAEEQALLKGRAVKILRIRRIVFPVNSAVITIVNNRELRHVNMKQIKAIFKGDLTSWLEVEGVDLPVIPLLLAAGRIPAITSFPGFSGKETEVAGNVLRAEDPVQLAALVAGTAGAIGACHYEDWAGAPESLLSIRRKVTKGNLDIYYLLEAPAASGAWGGISTIIINTLIFILFTVLFAAPIGVCAAIFLTEYAKQNRLIRILRLGIETLSGIPSIIFGLFGFIFFVFILKLGIGFISAVLTITLMILPTIIRTSEEAFKAVPVTYREGSLALGATKLQTVFRVVIPAALPGIVSGVILALGRTIGETAVLIYTMGSNYDLVRGFSSSARVLSLHLYNMFAEAISFERCFATGTILIIIILIVNLSSRKLIESMYKKSGAGR